MFDLHQGYEEATDVLLVWLYTLDKCYVQSVLRDHAQEKLRTTLVLLELTQVYDIKDDRFKDRILDLITEFFEKAIAAFGYGRRQIPHKDHRYCPNARGGV